MNLDLTTFNPLGISQAIAGVIFYALVLIAFFLSTASIYTLIRHGKSKGLAFVISIIYMIFFFAIIKQGILILNSIK